MRKLAVVLAFGISIASIFLGVVWLFSALASIGVGSVDPLLPFGGLCLFIAGLVSLIGQAISVPLSKKKPGKRMKLLIAAWVIPHVIAGLVYSVPVIKRKNRLQADTEYVTRVVSGEVPFETLIEKAELDDVEVRAVIKKLRADRELSPEILSRLSEHPSAMTYIREEVLRHPMAPPAAFESVFEYAKEDDNWRLLEELRRNERTPPEIRKAAEALD